MNNYYILINGSPFEFLEFTASMTSQLYIEIIMQDASEVKRILDNNKNCQIQFDKFIFNVLFYNQVAENKILFIGEHK